MSSLAPPRTWPRDAFNIAATIVFASGAVAIAIIAIVAYLTFAIKSGQIDMHRPRRVPVMTELIGELVIYVPVGAYLLSFLPAIAKRSLRDLGLRPPGWREIGIGLLGALVMILAVNLTGVLMVALTHRQDTEAAIALLKQIKTRDETFLFIAIAVVFAPMLEELGFRVFLFNSFTRYASVPVAIVLSGAFFGVVHAASAWQLLTVSVPLAAGGIVLAAVYAWSRNYWASVITHSAFNAIPLTLYFVFHIKT
jgi:membrane protease YdiL (CAAX protease family)